MKIEELYRLYLSSTGVTTDTRNIGSGNIFFALKGEKFNANTFAADAIQKGAAYVVVDEIAKPEWRDQFADKLIVVEDVLKTLQALAAHHRSKFRFPVLAITGSNGKTTTKELIAAVLSKRFKTYATKGNLNNHIGVPLTLLSISSDAEFAVVEMGANHQREIASYCEYAAPDFGLITNVGLAHTEGFGGFEGVVKGKTELYEYLAKHEGKIFLNTESDVLKKRSEECGFSADDIILYGKNKDAFVNGRISTKSDFLSVTISKEITIQTNLVGDYNFENVLAAVCVGKYFGVEMMKIKEAIESYVPSNNRSQKVLFGNNTVILDAYNANPSSMIEALKNFERIPADNKMVILGEMMELGNYAAAEHQRIAQTVKGMNLRSAVFTGGGFSFLQSDPHVKYFAGTDELRNWFRNQKLEHYNILIKGSRKNELEKLLND